MNKPENNAAHIQWLIALGNQPGVSAWFAVWTLFKQEHVAESSVVPATEGDAHVCLNTTS